MCIVQFEDIYFILLFQKMFMGQKKNLKFKFNKIFLKKISQSFLYLVYKMMDQNDSKKSINPKIIFKIRVFTKKYVVMYAKNTRVKEKHKQQKFMIQQFGYTFI